MAKEKVVQRKDIKNDTYREILDIEKHHDHVIIKDESGIYRWKANPFIREMMDKKPFLNDLLPILDAAGYGKNSEVYRKIYRDLGYSLNGYWEVFYWEANNPDADLYKPNSEGLPKE